MIVPDLGGEEYYITRDEFLRYIEDKVNPARKAEGLTELREKEISEGFRILYEFWRDFDKRP